MKSAVTISLVAEAKGGPFVFWDKLADACRSASELSFDAVEVFAPAPDAIEYDVLRDLLSANQLSLAAVGTGAGWVKHQLTLTSPDATVRQKAIDFIKRMIDFGGRHGAPAIIGSMQGRWTDQVSKPQALEWLCDALVQLGSHAAQHQVPLIYEPLNRYETNLVNTMAAGAELLSGLSVSNVRLLADLFHMNIEESSLSDAILAGGKWIGHIHFVDSNRRPAGFGHLDYGPIWKALHTIGYAGYLSAEALPWPDSKAAAAQTIQQFRKLNGIAN